MRAIAPDASLSDVSMLQGGVSATTLRLDLRRASDDPLELAVRMHGDVDLERNPHVATMEFALLGALIDAGIPVPRPVYLDQHAEYLDRPGIVTEFVEGRISPATADPLPIAAKMAELLWRIHQVELPSHVRLLLPDADERTDSLMRSRSGTRDREMSEARILDALNHHWISNSGGEAAVVHGDYWPGNVIWRDGEIAAVIDWEDAGTGNPLNDVANCRLEILWMYGMDPAREFTEQYAAAAGTLDRRALALWDLMAALRPAGKIGAWGLDPLTEQRMRERHRHFVERAVRQLEM
ncbi:MAG: phosphotransferase family protein [Chloroflexota bacterium]